MCGLIGFSGVTDFDPVKIQQLMIWNAFERGNDATGIYSPNNGLVKNAKHATKFLITQELKSDSILISHVRAATVGNKDLAKNAHPFKRDNIVLAHNGTLDNHWELLRKYDLDFTQYDVDSDIICGIINKNKSFDVLKEISGAAALLINNIDYDPKVLFVYRNDKRPLYKGYIDGNMYISSIGESLTLIGCKNVKEFKTDTLYKIKDGIIISTIKIVNRPYKEVKNDTKTFYPASYYFNTWLTLKYNNAFKSRLTEGDMYLVKDFNIQNITFTINDDYGNAITLGKYLFDIDNDIITEGFNVKANSDLFIDSKKVATNNELFYVTEDYPVEGNVKAISYKTNKELVIPKNLLYRLSINEENSLQKSLTNNTDVTQTELQFSNIHNLPQIEDVNNEQSNIEESDLILDDFINDCEVLDTDLSLMFNYAEPLLNNEQKTQFTALYQNCENKLINLVDKYSDIKIL